MKTKLLEVLLLLVIAVPSAFCEELQSGLDLNLRTRKNNTQFTLGTQYSNFQMLSRGLGGYGIQLGFEYALLPSWSIQANLSQGFDASGGAFHYLFTDVNAFVYFALLGDFIPQDQEILYHDQGIVKTNTVRGKTVSIGMGAEQMLLNGASQVYPATGISLALRYHFPMFNQWFVASVRDGMFSLNRQSFNGLFLGISVLLDL